MKKRGMIWAIIYIVFGLYFINSAFLFIVLPEIVLGFDNWITLIGGILILLGGVNYFRAKRQNN